MTEYPCDSCSHMCRVSDNAYPAYCPATVSELFYDLGDIVENSQMFWTYFWSSHFYKMM